MRRSDEGSGRRCAAGWPEVPGAIRRSAGPRGIPEPRRGATQGLRDRHQLARTLTGWPLTLGLAWFGLGRFAVAWAGPPEPATESAEQPSTPEPTPEATPEATTAAQWYGRGIELGSVGEFDRAAEAFLRSYALQPTSEALFNAGLAYENAGEAIAAIDTYRRFLAEPERNEALVRAAEGSIDALLRKVAVLKGVRYAPSRPPAEFYVAGALRELDELPLLLPPGPVVIEVVDARGDRARETYEIAGGEALIVDLRALLPPEPEPVVEIDPGPTPKQLETAKIQARRAKRLRTATWVGIGLTGAAGITAATLGGLAARENRSYRAFTCFEFEGGVCPEGFVTGDPQAHLLAFNHYRTGAGITAGVTGGLVIGTLVVGLLSVRFAREAKRTRSRVRFTPSLGGFVLEF